MWFPSDKRSVISANFVGKSHQKFTVTFPYGIFGPKKAGWPLHYCSWSYPFLWKFFHKVPVKCNNHPNLIFTPVWCTTASPAVWTLPHQTGGKMTAGDVCGTWPTPTQTTTRIWPLGSMLLLDLDWIPCSSRPWRQVWSTMPRSHTKLFQMLQ